MKPLSNDHEFDLKLDESGKIDVDYYYRKAQMMRANHIRDMASGAKARIKTLFKSISEKLFCGNAQTSH